jgi:hypothetical protein
MTTTHKKVSRRELGPLLLLPFVTLACAPRRESKSAPDPVQPEYDGPMVDPREIPWDFLWRQRVSAKHGGSSGAFDAVVQKKGDTLLILGLTPFQTRGFSLTQNGTLFEYEQFVPFELPFSPKSVLIDIHRSFFFGLLEDLPPDGTRHLEWKNEHVADRVVSGRLRSRTFLNVGGPGGRITLSYGKEGYRPGTPPPLVLLTNEPYGYELQVRTTETQRL